MIPTIDKKFERFVKELKNSREDVITDNEHILYTSAHVGFGKVIYSKNSYYSTIKNFYSSRNIESKGISFNNGSAVGIWYYFDQTGRLAREEDTDAGYNFSPDDVIKYCEKHNINLPKGYQDSGFQTSVLKEELNTKKVWVISHQISGDQIERIVLDGNTGMEVHKERVPFINN